MKFLFDFFLPSKWNHVPESITNDIKSLRSQKLLYGLGVIIGAFHILINSFLTIDSNIQNILHFTSFVIIAGIIHPFLKKDNFKSFRFIDYFFIILIAGASVFAIFSEDMIYERGVRLEIQDWIAAIIIILGAIELTRRMTGWIIPLMIIFFLSYVTWLGAYIPGVFKFKGLKLETVLFRSLFGDDALFGTIAGISSSFVFVFIIFGSFLLRSGAGGFIISLSNIIAQKIVGGPGIVAVIASGLTGTISGSAISNTASTGVITIPMMKKIGFSPKFAAGVEAAASTGGQLMPPIMGAGAFILASYTQIPYGKIVAVSFLPALLYFFSLIFYVRNEAYKIGLDKVKVEQSSPRILPLIYQEGISFIFPVIVLITLLIMGYTSVYAGCLAILAVIISSWFTSNKLGIKGIMDALAMGTKNMLTSAILLCSVGLIINVITTTGIGNTFSLMIIEWSNQSLLIAVFLIAVASLILGMGLPVTAAYIVLATLSAPALNNLILNNEIITQLSTLVMNNQVLTIISLSNPDILSLVEKAGGILSLQQAKQVMDSLNPETIALLQPLLLDTQTLTLSLLSAHMVIFWLSQDSNITPPVCLCAFTAAGIANSPPMATGFTSWKIAKSLYIVPLLFIYTDILNGNFWDSVNVFVFAIIGFYSFAGAIQGWIRFKLGWLTRLIMVGFALIFFYPLPFFWHSGIMIFFFFFIFLLSKINQKKLKINYLL